MRRSIGVPLAIGIGSMVLVLALSVGWQILVWRDATQLSDALTPLDLVLFVLGTLFFLLVFGGLVWLSVKVVIEMRLNQSPARVPRRRDPRDEDAALLVSPLARDARAPRARGGAARPSSSSAWARISIASRARSSRCSPRRGPRRARVRANSARASSSGRCWPSTSRSSALATASRGFGRARREPTPARARRRGGARAGVPQPARERRQVLAGSGADPGRRSKRRETGACASRSRTGASGSRSTSSTHLPALLPRGSRRPAPGRGPRARSLHRAHAGAQARRADRRAQRGRRAAAAASS